jgi:hypothetical protein
MNCEVKIYISEIEEMLRKYREKYSIGREFELNANTAFGRYLPSENKITIPNPPIFMVEEIMSEIERRFPYEGELIRRITKKAIEYTSSITREHVSVFQKLRDSILKEIKSNYKLLIEDIKKIRDIEETLDKLSQFLNANSRYRLFVLSEYIYNNLFAIGGAIFYNSIIKSDEDELFLSEIRRRKLFDIFYETFQILLSLYFLTKIFERSYIPLVVVENVYMLLKKHFDEMIKISSDEKLVLYGFGIKEILDEIGNLYRDKALYSLREEQIKRRVKLMRKNMRRRIEYLVGIMKSKESTEVKIKNIYKIIENNLRKSGMSDYVSLLYQKIM